MKIFQKYFLFGLIFLFASLLYTNSAMAETDIYGGIISQDTTWTADGSPYVIYAATDTDSGESNFTIDASTTLTIEAGVVVKFDYGQSMNVLGNLVANGTSDNKVYFTSMYDGSVGGNTDYSVSDESTTSDSDIVVDESTSSTSGDGSSDPIINDVIDIAPSSSDWIGIEAINGGNIELKNSLINYSSNALHYDSSSGQLDNVDIENSQYGILASSSVVEINNSNFSNLSILAYIYSSSSLSISNSIINSTSEGIMCDDGSNLIFGNSSANISGTVLLLFGNSNANLNNLTIKNSYRIALSFDGSGMVFANSSIDKISGEVFMTFDKSNLKLNNLTVTNITGGVAETFDESHLKIQDTNIENVNDRAIMGFDRSVVDFNNSTLKNLTDGAFMFYGGSGGSGTTTLNISCSTISDGKSNGIGLYGAVDAKLDKTNIQNFLGDGMLFYSNPTILVTDSNISNNGSGIVSYGANVEIKNSIISGNHTYGVYNIPVGYAPVIEAINNWWGDKSGPFNADTNASGTANQVSSNVDFSPWLKRDPNNTRNPVVIIPGTAGSYLYTDNGNEIWPNVIEALVSKGDNYLDQLILTETGKSDTNKPYLIPKDAIRKIEFSLFNYKIDYFDGLIKQLESDGYVEGQDLFVFPYDWRLDIRDDIPALKNKIEEIRQQTGSDKVDIIAHSMGGLLAKEYIKNYGQDKVGKFVDIATPHLGAPMTFKILMSGDNLGIKLFSLSLNEQEVKKMTQNMPSVYQLLPSPGYFSDILSDYKYYIDDMSDFDNNGVKDRLSYSESNQFLKNSGRNANILDSAITLHNDIDNMNPADYGVQAYNIVGCGTPTLGKFFTLGKETEKDPEFSAAFITGDDTVPERSAEAIPSVEQYYDNKNVSHGTLPSASGVKQLVSRLLSGTESNFDFGAYNNISTTSEKCKIPNGKVLMFHSPVDVNIYDEADNHTGPNASGTIEYAVPGIAYEIFENNKFVFLPDDQHYRVELNATDIGSFSAHIQKMVDGNIISTEYFNSVPLVSTSTKAEVELSDSTSTIALDSTGDGISIDTIKPSSEMAYNSLSDNVPPFTNMETISPLSISSDGAVLENAKLTLSAIDTDSGILKTQYSFDRNNWMKYEGQMIDTAEKNIYYYSVDNAGNIESIKTISIPVKTIQNNISLPVSSGLGGWGSDNFQVNNNATQTKQVIYIQNIENNLNKVDIISKLVKNISNNNANTENQSIVKIQTDGKNSVSEKQYSTVLSSNSKNKVTYLIIVAVSLIIGIFFLGKKCIKR
jgi:pimeloyl-ACP methyl ester carboxylesterase